MEFTFATVDVKAELVTILKAELPKKGFKDVKVVKGDPATHAELPCVGINRIDDSETNQSLADASGTAYDKDTQTYTTFQGTFFSEAMELRVWHTNADSRSTLYVALKAILFAFRRELVGKGLLQVELRSGRDEQDTTMKEAPLPIYWSTITMTYLNPLDVEITETVAPISAVIDQGGVSSPSNP